MFLFKKAKEELYPIGKEIPPKKTDNYRFLDSITVHALKTGRNRMMFLASLFLFAFGILSLRLFQQSVLNQNIRPPHKSALSMNLPVSRADIVDRNGHILASTVPVYDLYIDARQISDPDQMINDIMDIFPDLDKKDVEEKINSGKAFNYLRRNLTPKEKMLVNNLGYPQLNFISSERRFYPQQGWKQTDRRILKQAP